MKEASNDSFSEQRLIVNSVEALREHLRASAWEALKEILEQEIHGLCGERYHPGGGDCRRAGTTPSYVMTDARREAMERPRVRRERPDGKTEEVPLKSWKMAQSPDEWEAAMMRAVLCGVSTRGCKRLRPDDLVGESRSSICRLWQRKATELVERVQQSDLSGIDLVVLMLDGVVLCKGLVATVALGIDSSGTKHILGFRVGSSENREVCRWREETHQANRWLASGLVLASEGFRKISGHSEIPTLVAALERKMAEEQNHQKEAA